MKSRATLAVDLSSAKDYSAILHADGKIAFLTPPAPKNDHPRMIDFLDDLKTGYTADEFRRLYQTDWSDMPTLKPSRDYTDTNFIEAFETASKVWGHEVDMSLIINKPDMGYYDPRLLHDWIWGPHGEFTAFAKIRAFDEIDTQAGYSGRGRKIRNVTFTRNRHLSHVKFNVTVLREHGDMSSRFILDDPRDRRNSCSFTFVQFATYEDYVAWEALAATDPLGRERRDYACD